MNIQKSFLLASLSLSIVCLTNTPSSAFVVTEDEMKETVMTGEVRRYVSVADQMLIQGKYEDAETWCRRALAENPKDIPAMIRLGWALGKQFKLDSADECFNKALLVDPDNALAHTGKAMVLVNRLQSSSGTIIANRVPILKSAEEEAKLAIIKLPESPIAHYELGVVYKEQVRFPEATVEFKNAIKLEPQFSDAYTGLGMLQLEQGAVKEAEFNFKQAIAINSFNSAAHYGLGAAYLKQGKVDNAISELNTSLYQYRNNALAHLALGDAFSTQGNTDAAIREYKLSVLIKPENAEPYIKMAKIWESRGDLEEALVDFHSAFKLTPNDLNLQLHIADISLQLHKFDNAIQGYQSILTVQPANLVAIQGLSQAFCQKAESQTASALFATNEYEQAMQSLGMAIQLRLAMTKLTRMSGKSIDVTQIVAPTNDGERVAYCEALMSQGLFAQENDQMSMLVEKVNNAKQMLALADLAFMMKDLDNAEIAYKKALVFADTSVQQRAQKGLANIENMRRTADEDLRVATELFNKKQFEGAIDRYHQVISENPKLTDAHIGLAKSLEKLRHPSYKQLKEAAEQYREYVVLQFELTPSEKNKLLSRADKLDAEALNIATKNNDRIY